MTRAVALLALLLLAGCTGCDFHCTPSGTVCCGPYSDFPWLP